MNTINWKKRNKTTKKYALVLTQYTQFNALLKNTKKVVSLWTTDDSYANEAAKTPLKNIRKKKPTRKKHQGKLLPSKASFRLFD